ncbi:MAG: Methionine-tRNA ligase [Candidatus Collierbacteria bacterium GW2011_GWA1_42_60]|nr:MAG: Methionine-tRNA ligase [Candidatus Collierbacteria bacterium GW2011_GWA1_42_60]
MGKYYITTTLPYVNAEPHIGFAMEIVRADVMARLHRALGDDVFFNTGTDEHGQKIYQKAVELGIDPQKYCDESAAKFSVLKEALNLSYNSFVRTTDEHHIKAAQEFWKLCDAKGDIYKKNYKIKYCVGCELEKTFRFSNYQERLLELYKNNPDFVQPDFRQNEMKIFVGGGLQDFSISRLKAKMPWGVEVPGDSEQVMFVWFDALVNYISSLGWPENKAKFKEYWPGVQICGKDNLRQQTAMWQAMLMSAGLPTSKQIVVEGFITSGGAKMSKSLGNVIDPLEYVEKYGTDAVRYFLTAELSVFEDSDITKERFEEAFQASLANGIGNLCARVAAMSEKEGLRVTSETLSIRKEVLEKLEKYRFDEAMALIWEEIKKADGLINQRQVWKLEGEKKIASLNELVKIIRQIGVDLVPFMPATSEKIMAQYGVEEIKKAENLFARLS